MQSVTETAEKKADYSLRELHNKVKELIKIYLSPIDVEESKTKTKTVIAYKNSVRASLAPSPLERVPQY